MNIDGLPITSPDVDTSRFVGIIWGLPGQGKTPLVATSEPPILFIMFDHDGWKSIQHMDDRFRLLNLTGNDETIVDKFESLNTVFFKDLEKYIKAEGIRTICLDSVTSFLDKCLVRGIQRAGPLGNERPSLVAPGMRGYGARSMLIRQCVMNLHTLASRNNCHFIITAHEKNEYGKDAKGDEVLEEITLLLGGEAFVQVPKHFSEIWRLEEKQGQKQVQLRPHGKVRIVRTRMFDTRNLNPPKFVWDFDTYDWKGEGIQQWMERWKANKGRAIKCPGMK